MTKEEYRRVLNDRLSEVNRILGKQYKGNTLEVVALVSLECDLCEKLYKLDNDEVITKEALCKMLIDELNGDNCDNLEF